jgi:serine protease
MKKVAVGIAIVLGLTLLSPAVAETNPSIVIIDTAIDTTLTEIKDKVIYEVCITERSSCPNGKSFQEGPGSATLPANQIYANGFDHGTIMTSIATQINSNVNIIFIRIVGRNTSGSQQQYTEKSIINALDWVANNKDKFNIVSASASLGHNNFKTMSNYCPVNPALKNNIIKLQSLGVASVFAAGNKYDYSRVDYPSCIAEAISIGATEKNNRISLYSNGGMDIDFYALGTYRVKSNNVVGTSASTVAFSAYWAKNYKGSYSTTYDYMKSIAFPTENTKIKSTTFVDILKQ